MYKNSLDEIELLRNQLKNYERIMGLLKKGESKASEEVFMAS